ncbi:MAG: ATP-NAD kinase family protein [Crenarchaeota archaeon]|nr:ATP-NAD kinase family protein [Thermoproteota archaeon]
MIEVCLAVNPIAGMGGPLALKGTDGEARWIALRRGAKPISPSRAERFLRELKRHGVELLVYTATGLMGEAEARRTGHRTRIVHVAPEPTSRHDTFETVYRCLSKGVEIIIVVGGDGTLRDAYLAAAAHGGSHVIIPVPAGVKMYSAAFPPTPEEAAHALMDYLKTGSACLNEVADIDEESFRRNKLIVRLYGYVKTPCRHVVGVTKEPPPPGEDEAKKAIARRVVEDYAKPCTLLILGPGTTTKAIADLLGAEKTLLGVDVIHNGKTIARDADEETIYRLLKSHLEGGGKAYLVVSPIGGQGFILGRGNQQISPRILRLLIEKMGKDAIVVVSTPSKLRRVKILRVDTGDPELDAMLRGYIRVITDYNEETLVRVV